MTKRSWIAAFVAALMASFIGAGIGEAIGEESAGMDSMSIMLGRVF